MGLLDTALKNPTGVAAAAAFVGLFGVLSLFQLPVQPIPDVERPTLAIETLWRTASAQEIESEVLDPQERVLRGLPGIVAMDGSAFPASAFILLEFEFGTNMQATLIDVISRLNRVQGLPRDAEPPVVELGGGGSGTAESRALSWFFIQREPGNNRPMESFLLLIQDVVRPHIESVPRVAGKLRMVVEPGTRVNAADSVARNKVDELETERAMVRQDHTLAMVERDRAAYRIEQARVTAPYADQVVERLSEQGEFAQVGQSVVRLVNLEDWEVPAKAPLRVAPHLRDGQLVPVRHDDQAEPLLLAISTIIPVGDMGSRSFEVRLHMADDRRVIGAPVEVGLPTALPRRVVAVPRNALVLRDERTLVSRINASGLSERMQVTTGIGIGEWIEIDASIKAGDRVVIRGAETLRDGQPVNEVANIDSAQIYPGSNRVE